MTRKALIDSATGVLLEHGFVDYQALPGQEVVDVDEDFSMEPGAAQRKGDDWRAYMPPPKTEIEKTVEATGLMDQQPLLKAVILWLAQIGNKKPEQALSEIAAIYGKL